MKKLFSHWKPAKKPTMIFAGLGLMLFGLVVYAAGLTPYAGVNVNNTSVPFKEAGSFVTAEEFNTLTNSVRGIFNTFDGVTHRIGLNRAPAANIDFDIDGDLRIGGTTEACVASTAGLVYFNDTNHKFWGCDGTNWLELGGSGGSSNYNYLCQANGSWLMKAACAVTDYTSGATTYTENDVVCASSNPDPVDCEEVMYDYACQADGSWSKGASCGLVNYTSGHSYTTGDSVCAIPTPNNADCGATPSNYSYICQADGSWLMKTTCATANYTSGATTYAENDVICATSTPDNTDCGTASPNYNYTCGDGDKWTQGSTCAVVDYIRGKTPAYQDSDVVCADSAPDSFDCNGLSHRVCDPNVIYETQCYVGDVWSYNECEQKKTTPAPVSCNGNGCTNNDTGVLHEYANPARNKYNATCDGGGFSCTGTVPTNATLCAGDDTGLTSDTARSVAADCSAIVKCKYTCDAGYVKFGDSCVLDRRAYTCNNGTWDEIGASCSGSEILYNSENVGGYSDGVDVCAVPVPNNATCNEAEAKVDGVCRTFNGRIATQPTTNSAACDAGSYVDGPDMISGANSSILPYGTFTWKCEGAGGGTDAYCSADMLMCADFKEAYNDQPVSLIQNNACFAGVYVNVLAKSGDTRWGWKCKDNVTGNSIDCFANKPIKENGDCKSYPSYYKEQPAMNTANGCDAGVFEEVTLETASQFAWKCKGVFGGTDETCYANRLRCGVFTAVKSTQDANSMNGCIHGTYENVAGIRKGMHRWKCKSSPTEYINCYSPAENVTGQCRFYSEYYYQNPATRADFGCTAGIYEGMDSGGSQWEWRCLGAGTGTTANCVANKYISYPPEAARTSTAKEEPAVL